MKLILALPLVAVSALACTGPASTSTSGLGSGGFGTVGNTSTGGFGSTGTTGGFPNSSLEGALAFDAGVQGQNVADKAYPDGGFGYVIIQIGESDCGAPPFLQITVGSYSVPSLVIGNYPIGDGGTDTPPVDAGASLIYYSGPGEPGLPAVDGFVFFNSIGADESIGNFSVDLALPDGGTSNLSGTFDVTNSCIAGNGE